MSGSTENDLDCKVFVQLELIADVKWKLVETDIHWCLFKFQYDMFYSSSVIFEPYSMTLIISLQLGFLASLVYVVFISLSLPVPLIQISSVMHGT
jgi:hypothetical protein